MLSTLKRQAEELQQVLASFQAVMWTHREDERTCDSLGLKECVLKHDLMRMEMTRKRRELRRDLGRCMENCFPRKEVKDLEEIDVNSKEKWEEFQLICKCHRSCVHSVITDLRKVNTDMQEVGMQVSRAYLPPTAPAATPPYF